jgi:quercetin dioxygenase-like cupin family protein
MTIAYYDLEAGASLHAHAHPNEGVWNLIEGDVELTLGDVSRVLSAGAKI